MKGNKKQITIAVVFTIIAAAGIIALTIYLNNEQKVPTQNGVISVETEDDEDFYANIEEEAEERFEEHYDLIDMFIETYNIRAYGSELLYTESDDNIDSCQWLYMDADDKAANFHETTSQITIEGTTYTMYETGIEYEEYKQELCKIMSEDIYEQYFTPYVQNIDGKLYITNQELQQQITIQSLEEIEEDQYNLTYNQNGETKEVQVTIDSNNGKITQIQL